MQERLDFLTASPAAIRAMIALETSIGKLGLEAKLLELVRLRASQINGCAYCVDAHASDALKHGESQRRLHAVAAWRESPLFSPSERAALNWTESMTLVAQTHAPDADYESLSAHFTEAQRVDLTLAIGSINTWNRIAIGFRKIPAD